jgi:heme A synthase
VIWPWHLFWRRRVGVTAPSRLDVPVMVVLAVAWLVGSGILTILMSAPSTRYVETASLLVAPIFIYWAVLLAMPRLAGPAPS